MNLTNVFGLICLAGDEEPSVVTSLRCSTATVCKADLHHCQLEHSEGLAHVASLWGPSLAVSQQCCSLMMSSLDLTFIITRTGCGHKQNNWKVVEDFGNCWVFVSPHPQKTLKVSFSKEYILKQLINNLWWTPSPRVWRSCSWPSLEDPKVQRLWMLDHIDQRPPQHDEWLTHEWTSGTTAWHRNFVQALSWGRSTKTRKNVPDQ